jgi:hypothetical protein
LTILTSHAGWRIGQRHLYRRGFVSDDEQQVDLSSPVN